MLWKKLAEASGGKNHSGPLLNVKVWKSKWRNGALTIGHRSILKLSVIFNSAFCDFLYLCISNNVIIVIASFSFIAQRWFLHIDPACLRRRPLALELSLLVLHFDLHFRRHLGKSFGLHLTTLAFASGRVVDTEFYWLGQKVNPIGPQNRWYNNFSVVWLISDTAHWLGYLCLLSLACLCSIRIVMIHR